MDEFGICDVIRHLEICFNPKTSKNSVHRSIQRDARRNIHLGTEDNPARKTKDIINDGLRKIPELRAPNGHLVAGGAAARGIKRKNERESTKYLKKKAIGTVDVNNIPTNLMSMVVDYPGFG